MPRLEILNGFHMQAVKSTEPEDDGDGVTTVDVWTLILSDRHSGDQIRLSFRKDARDELVRQLTGGVVLAGGELPRL